MSKILLSLLMPMCAVAVVDLSPNAGLQVKNLVPKFEAFYTDAGAAGVRPDQRWDLWVKEYGFAAVPPTPEGQTLARKQLDAVWNRYVALVPTLYAREARAELSAREMLPKVESLLNPGGKPTPVMLILFVGQFDGNEFTAPPQSPGGPAVVMMPIETDNIRFALAQEFAHAVQIDVDHLQNGFDSPLAETVLTVGIAMHATERVLPGHPASLYTWRAPEWLPKCLARSRAVLKGIEPYLSRAGSDNTTRFTYGRGSTGLESEAYCAGWVLIGDLLQHGYSYPALAKIPEKDMVRFAEARIADLLTHHGSGL